MAHKTLIEAIRFYRVSIPLRVLWWAEQWWPLHWFIHQFCRWRNPGCNTCFRHRMGIISTWRSTWRNTD